MLKKLRLLAHSRSFLANQKARNAIVEAENLLRTDIQEIELNGEIRNVHCTQPVVFSREALLGEVLF